MTAVTQKPLWAEGTFLHQQHFQQWDLYWAQQLQSRLASVAPLGWGLQQVTIDHQALATGYFQVLSARAVFAHGLSIAYDESADQPLQCELPASADKPLCVYLCVPANNAAVGVTGYDPHVAVARWQANYRKVADCFDPQRQQEILLGQLNLQLVAGEHPNDGYHSLAIAQVVPSETGGWQLASDYIPPVLWLAASQSLCRLMKKIMTMLAAKLKTLQKDNHTMMTAHQINQQLALKSCLLLLLNQQALIELKHLITTPQQHPQQLYLLLIRLISGLCAVHGSAGCSDMPSYQHAAPTDMFAKLYAVLVTLLNNNLPSQHMDIVLKQLPNGLYTTNHIAKPTLHRSSFYIAVQLHATDRAWIDQFAKTVKVGAMQAIEQIMASALPGVGIRHQQQLPHQLTLKPGYEYFYIEKQGEFWQQIVEQEHIALFVPKQFSAAVINIISMQENHG